MARILLRHHKDNWEDAISIYGRDGIKQHATNLGQKNNFGRPLYPHLTSNQGIDKYVSLAKSLLEELKDGSTVIVKEERGKFVPDEICNICPWLKSGRCERG